jgi:DNA-binding NtrC family response regulator
MHTDVVVIDDQASMVKLLSKFLPKHGFTVRSFTNPAEAVVDIERQCPDIVLTDLRMPSMDGLELLTRVRQIDPRVPVLIMTAFGSVDSAVQAIKQGASDYITKPFNMDEVVLYLNRALEINKLRDEVEDLRSKVGVTHAFSGIITRSSRMRDVLELVKRIANAKSTVLIRGKSGTGKELIAHALHEISPRAKNAFMAINCSALPESLLESELFGHVRGAFTGAVVNKRGLFEEARGGTLFLDEIGEISPAIQMKLLRVLQDHEIRPVGGNVSKQIDVRIVAATNADLEAMIEKGTFREDLYYRLSVIPIHLPDLKERREDVPLLAMHFIKRFAAEAEKPVTGIEEDAIQHLCQHEWPGNVRELENVIERTVMLTNNPRITIEDLPASFRPGADKTSTSTLPSGWTLEQLEDAYIEQVLTETSGHKTKAAEILGIDRRTLHRKIGKQNSDN